ncbi:MAG: nucleoside phosphorylase [Clostridia bacterium]|nr:nucleoside phosphorylase [Clostridia bacterium]
MIKHSIPLLEYDDDPHAVIDPDHEGLGIHLPAKAVFAFLQDHVDAYAKAAGARTVGYFRTITKNYPVYVLTYKGEEICLCQAPLGAPAAAQFLDWLIGYGANKIISGGCCGALEELPENLFLVPSRALRDEGTSYHYLPAARFVDVDLTAREAIRKTLTEHGLSYREVTTWTTDGFYRETREKVAYRRAEGCTVVDMECSALAAVAERRGVHWGQILFTADSLANVDSYDERGWGRDSFDYALRLCLDAVLKL